MKKLNSGLFFLMSSCFIARQNNRLINRQVQHDAMQKKKQAVSYNNDHEKVIIPENDRRESGIRLGIHTSLRCL